MSTKFLSPGWRMPRNANQSKFSNYSMDFDGTSGIQCGDIPQLNSATKLSFNVWLNYESMTQRVIFSKEDSTNAIRLYNWSSGVLYFWLKNSGSGTVSYVSNFSSLVNLNEWNMLTVVYDGSQSSNNDKVKIFLNGGSSNILTNYGTIPTSTGNINDSFAIGEYSSGAGNKFLGQIDAVSIFNYALSSSQVTTLYGTGSAIGNPMALPSSPIAYYPLGTSAWNGNYLAENNAIGDYVFDFPSGDYVNLGSPSPLQITGSLTLSSWVKYTSGSGGNKVIIAKSDGTNESYFLSLLGNHMRFSIFTGNSGDSPDYFEIYADQEPEFVQDTWYHIVGVFESGVELRAYINGVPVIDTDIPKATSRTTINVNNTDVTIGMFSTGTQYPFLGNISNSQIWNTALTNAEVQTLYNYGSPIQTLASIPQSSNLKAWYKLDASEVYNSTTTEWIVGDSSGNYPTSLSFVKKANGSGNAITIYQGTDGNGPSNLKFGASDSFSISTWVYLNTRNSDKYIFTARGSFSAGAQSFNRLEASPNGVDKQLISWLIRDDNNVSASVNTTLATSGHPDDFVWANVVAVTNRSAQTIQIFVNGVGSPTANISSLGGFQNQDSIVIGNDGYTAQSGRYYYEGQLSNLAIFDKALTQSEINTLYNGGTPEVNISHSPVSWWKLDNLTTGLQDSAGGGNNATAASWITKTNNNVSTLAGISSGMTQANLVQSDLQTVAPYSKYAMNFDASSGDYIQINNGSSLTNGFSELTVSIWANFSGTGEQQIITKDGSSQRSFNLRRLSNGVNFLVSTDGTSNSQTLFYPSSSITIGEWYHFAGIYDGSKLLLYVNGSLIDDSVSLTGNLPNTTSGFYIGSYAIGHSYTFNGSLSNASIWDTALTSSQVSEIYNEGLPSDLNSHSAYSNLVSWWQLGENSSFDGNDWICADEKGSNNGTSTGMPVSALVNGVGTTANGVSSGMSEGNLVGDAPYSTANAISSGMSVESRVTGSGNTP